MISTLRALFLARLFREKLLLVAFALILMAFWLSSFVGRVRAFSTDEQKASQGLKVQAIWLAKRPEINDLSEKALVGFEPTKTLDSTELLGRVTRVANNAGLTNTSSGGLQDVPADKFTYHQFDFNINKVDWGHLQAFCFALQAERPYIGIQKFVAVGERTNPPVDSLSVRITVFSVEIPHGGAQ